MEVKNHLGVNYIVIDSLELAVLMFHLDKHLYWLYDESEGLIEDVEELKEMFDRMEVGCNIGMPKKTYYLFGTDATDLYNSDGFDELINQVHGGNLEFSTFCHEEGVTSSGEFYPNMMVGMSTRK